MKFWPGLLSKIAGYDLWRSSGVCAIAISPMAGTPSGASRKSGIYGRVPPLQRKKAMQRNRHKASISNMAGITRSGNTRSGDTQGYRICPMTDRANASDHP
ncbi:hypothetical protein ACFTIK_15545, partial [Tistrella mobilis]|uniref:hypothetical protein n=1 Tax=Tistrella mobilis TaxID=171437 RepID=UPI00363D6A62